MKIISHPKREFVIQDYESENFLTPASMVVGWCRTTKFDWFAVCHESESHGELTESSVLTHITVDGFSDPRIELLDVAILHLIQPGMRNSGSLTPKISADIGFALFQHDFDDPTNTKILLTHRVLSRQVMMSIPRKDSVARAKCLNDVVADGFTLTLASEIFNPVGLKKICASFKSRIRRVMKGKK